MKSKEGAHKLKISHNLTMCWKASAHNLQIWGNTWVLYCSVLLLYSTNPESWNNKNRRCDEYKEITDGSNGKYLRWYRIRKEGEVEVINNFFWDVTLEKITGDWFGD